MTATSQRPLEMIRINCKGESVMAQAMKQQLAKELGLPLRDLRYIDPSYPSQIHSTFIARPGIILMSLEGIKVIVKSDEALIFGVEEPEVQKYVSVLQLHLRHRSALNAEKSPHDNLEHANNSRFELLVVDAALNLVCSSLLFKVRELEPLTIAALKDLRAESKGLDAIQTQADELLPVKNILDEYRKRIREIKGAISDVLNSDDDMAMMCLSTIPTTEEQQDRLSSSISSMVSNIKQMPASPLRRRFRGMKGLSPMEMEFSATESIFENYLHDSEWISAEIDDLLDEIKHTEDHVALQLDLLRNRILKVELVLSIVSFVVSLGGLVTGLFGMNLINHLEKSRHAFAIVSVLLAAGLGSVFQSLYQFAKYQKLL
jgi:magnesium transporter